MLSGLSRGLTYLAAAGFGLMGVVLFVAPSWAAAHFAWQISPFVAMTMGGWYAGMAVVAYHSARAQRWAVVHGCLIAVWAFGLGEALLLIVHRDVLRFDTVLGLPYMLMLVIAAANTVVGVVDMVRQRPTFAVEGLANPWWVRAMCAMFVVFVGYLAIPLLAGTARGGTVWPGQLSLLTARAFGAFFFALTLGMLPLVWARTLPPITMYMRTGLALVVPITIAAFVFYDQFDFRAQPGGLVYIGAYLVAFFGSLLVLGYAQLRRSGQVTPTAAGGAA